MSFTFTGTGVALVTPFTMDGAVDYDSLTGIINNIKNGGADYLVALGTTAETSALDGDEKKKVLAHVLKVAGNSIPVVLGIGGNNTLSVINEIKQTDFSSIAALLSVTPYYNRPSQEGLYNHYIKIAETSPVPVILYNVPSRTGVNMEASTSLRLATHPNISAIKEASGNITQAMEILRSAPSGFNLISGDDGISLPLMSMGASGVISVAANAIPSAVSALINACLAQDFVTARKFSNRLFPLFRSLFLEGNPVGIKAALSVLGFSSPVVRMPLQQASDGLISLIESDIKELNKTI